MPDRCLVITHRLDLALRLVDTATGALVSGPTTQILVDGKSVHRMEKPDGIMIFQGLGKKDYTLSIRARGFEPCDITVQGDALNAAMPLIEQHLIPSADYLGGPTLTLEGSMPGIEKLCAVKSGESSCLIREFDPRKRLLTIFNPHKLELDRMHYALVDPDSGTFEPFVIVKRVSEQVFKLDHPLQLAFRSHFPVAPLVLGLTKPDGTYGLRVRDDSRDACWLIHYQKDGQPQFHTVDFRRDEPACLP